MCPPQLTVKVEVPGTFTWDPEGLAGSSRQPPVVGEKESCAITPTDATELETETALSVAQFHFEHYKRRAEGEHKYRFAFWGAIIASMFLPIKEVSSLSPWIIAITAAALWILYVYWMYVIYADNLVDQNKYRYYIRIVENQLPASEFQTKSPVYSEGSLFGLICKNSSFQLQVLITGFLILISAFLMNHRIDSATAAASAASKAATGTSAKNTP